MGNDNVHHCHCGIFDVLVFSCKPRRKKEKSEWVFKPAIEICRVKIKKSPPKMIHRTIQLPRMETTMIRVKQKVQMDWAAVQGSGEKVLNRY